MTARGSGTNPETASRHGPSVEAFARVMGACLLPYPRVHVFALVPLGFLLTLPAWTVLLCRAAIQSLSGLTGLVGEERGGIAFWATSAASPPASS